MADATATTTTSPQQAVLSNYQYATDAAKALQQQPYTPYTGEIIPDVNAQQQLGFNQTQQFANAAQPAYQQGLGATNAAINQINAGQTAAQPYFVGATQDANMAMPGYQQAQGLASAGMTPLQQATYAAQPAYQQAMMGTAAASQGYNAPNYQTGVQGYLSPYTQNVVNATAAQMQNINQQQQQQLMGNAISQGAFGGDRGNIAMSNLMNQQNLAMGQTLGGLEQQGYQQAAQNYLTGTQQQGALANQYGTLGGNAQQALINAGLAQQQGAANLSNITGQAMTGAGMYGQLGTAAQNAALQGVPLSLAAGAQLGTLGAGQQTAGLAGATANQQAGAAQYGVQQAQDAAKYQQFAQAQAYPFQTLGNYANIAYGLGSAGGTTATTAPVGNDISSMLGLGTSLLGFFSASDERVKDNMEPIGKSFDGQNIYRFNYKGDPRTQLGFSAQEVEHHHPEFVRETDSGLKMVDYAGATSKAADKGHFAHGGSSMGGLVPESMERHPYATFGAVPYVDDPLYEKMTGKSGLDAGYVPHLTIAGHDVDPPKGVSPKEFASKYLTPAEDWSNLSPFLTAGKKFLGSTSTAPFAASPTSQDVINQYQNYVPTTYNFSDGGLVPRTHHASGDAAPTDQASTVPSSGGGLGDIIPNLFNKGQPLSDDARMGLIAAGLAMAGGTSPNAFVNIGQGGLTGMNLYGNLQKNEYDYRKAMAENALTARARDIEQQNADSSRMNALTSQLSVGSKTFEEAKQLYDFKTDSTGNLHVYGLGSNKEIPLSIVRDNLANLAIRLNIPVDKLIQNMATQQNPAQSQAGRSGHALGGNAGSTENVPSSASDIPSLSDDSSDVKKLALSVLRPSDIANDSATPNVKVAQAAPVVTTDVPPAPEKMHPTLQRIVDFNKKSQDLYKQADAIDGPGGQLDQALRADPSTRETLKAKAAAFRTQAYNYETQANALSNQDYVGNGNAKFRWELGAEPAVNPPPKPIDASTPRGQIDPDTGRVIPAPIDLGYPSSGGLPTVKLDKNQVLVGEDPMLSSAQKRSEDLLSDFQGKASGAQEGLINTIKFASALKVLESGALTGDATGLASIAQSLGFDNIARDLSLGKDVAAAETALKTQVDGAIAKATASFAKPTQSEFGLIERGATASRDMKPDSAHTIAQTTLAATLFQNTLMSEWEKEQANGARNFEAFTNTFRTLNGREKFEDAAGRLLGNFKGQPLPSDDKLVEGGVYVVPTLKKGTQADPQTQTAMQNGLNPGDVFSVKNVKHYTDNNGVQRVSRDLVKLDPNEIYQTMLNMPGIRYGM